MDEFRNKQVSVIGAARSGVAAAAVLTSLRAQVLLSDSKTAPQLGRDRLAEIEATGASAVYDASPEQAIPEGTDLIVTSPGVPRTAPVLQEGERRGIPIWSEIELAYRLANVPIVATTGTNGKTTTTILIGKMLQAAGLDAVVAGNVSADDIKLALVEAAMPAGSRGGRATEQAPGFPTATRGAAQASGADGAHARSRVVDDGGSAPRRILVAEVSSFQLEWVERFAPNVAVLTNITPDHLNRHTSFDEYAETKARIFAAQRPTDWALVNFDDPASRSIGKAGVPGRLVWFTRKGAPPHDGPAAWIEGGKLIIRMDYGAAPIPLLAASHLPFTLPGTHSLENVLAACFAAAALGVDADTLARTVRAFPGVPHRMELVAEVDGVRYINNSMCTNVAAAISSIRAMDRPTVVVAGGADKELDYTALVPALRARAKAVVLIGSVAEKMERTFRAHGYDAIGRAGTLTEAVAIARSQAVPGDAVLLSPACASFDMFSDFEARGRAFRQCVHALEAHQK